MSLLDYYFEELVILCGVFVVVGVDEVGCGFLVGLVMVVVVILYLDCIFEGLNDLKKFGKKCCEVFYDQIFEVVDVGFGEVLVVEIDEINILWVSYLVMVCVVQDLLGWLDYVLVDGKMIL